MFDGEWRCASRPLKRAVTRCLMATVVSSLAKRNLKRTNRQSVTAKPSRAETYNYTKKPSGFGSCKTACTQVSSCATLNMKQTSLFYTCNNRSSYFDFLVLCGTPAQAGKFLRPCVFGIAIPVNTKTL